MRATSAKLTRQYESTIPSKIWRRLHLKAGDVVQLTVEDGRVVLRAAHGGWTVSTRGSARFCRDSSKLDPKRSTARRRNCGRSPRGKDPRTSVTSIIDISSLFST